MKDNKKDNKDKKNKKGKTTGIIQLKNLNNSDFDKFFGSTEKEGKNEIIDNENVKTYTIELLYAGSGDIVFRDIITETGSDEPSENYNIIEKKGEKKGIFAPTKHILSCDFERFFSENRLKEINFNLTVEEIFGKKPKPKRHDNAKMLEEDNKHPIVLKYDGEYNGQKYVCLRIDENIKSTYGDMKTTIKDNEKKDIIREIVKDKKNIDSIKIELIAVLSKGTLDKTIKETEKPVLYFLKQNNNGVTFTFPGPECFKSGLQDKGCFSIKSNYNGSLSIIKKHIKDIESEYKKIEIEIQGHSRGAITAALVAEELKKNKNELSKLPIEIHYLGHDPVAGPPTTAIMTNSDSEDLLEEIRKRPEKPKDIGDKSVVIYSVSSGYPDETYWLDTNFKPGKLYQAKIIIIDSGDHAVKTYMGKEKNSLYEYNGETQRASKLDPGLYFEFGDNKLEKIDEEGSKSNALNAIYIIKEKCLKNNEKMRCKFLLNLIYSKSKLKITDLMNEDNSILSAFKNYFKTLSAFKGINNSSDLKNKIQSDLENIIQNVKKFKEKFFPVTSTGKEGNEFDALMKKFKECCLKNQLSMWAQYIGIYEFKCHTKIKKDFFKTLGKFSEGNFKDYISS